MFGESLIKVPNLYIIIDIGFYETEVYHIIIPCNSAIMIIVRYWQANEHSFERKHKTEAN